jgi:hypothetical protein
MSVQGRITELSQRHRQLDAAIDEALKRPAKDILQITELKRQKLRIKEELASLKGQRH